VWEGREIHRKKEGVQPEFLRLDAILTRGYAGSRKDWAHCGYIRAFSCQQHSFDAAKAIVQHFGKKAHFSLANFCDFFRQKE